MPSPGAALRPALSHESVRRCHDSLRTGSHIWGDGFEDTNAVVRKTTIGRCPGNCVSRRVTAFLIRLCI